MNRVRAGVALVLVALAPVAAAEGVEGTLSGGFGWFSHDGERGRVSADGVAVGLRIDGRVAPRIGLGVSFTWGLTDWDRAGEYIDAGNRAGSWTTDKFAQVERWATKKDENGNMEPERLVGALFADMFLAMSYAAVPICYAASAGGATTWLQLDGTATVHLSEDARTDGWLELGIGAAALPHDYVEWRTAFGPVVGIGMRYARLRLGVRALISPPGMNEEPLGGTIVAGALTLGLVL